ncbi:hypothetical protein GBA63_21735 (plasmid) [Rubrobacter tropicus]|uniref:Uncharacterized protein n=1 Tax=Rubrobacter tropicus TaxID=2653851 RepID=A0A6G8QFX1_9ACTN|nr:hypothetical protein [Rubrobacter tropicus]QIN85343.1 hypothetical protein GBA63_21735 [Rubrobacter tropicus]
MMHAQYTPEEVRTLLDQHQTLEYGSATDADVLDAADVLEGVDELVCKLDPAVRRSELLLSSLPAGEHFYVPVVRNCSRGAGVAIDPEGTTSFMVTGGEFGDDFPTYFSARQAVAHALLRRAEVQTPADGQGDGPLARGLAALLGPRTDAPEISAPPTDEDAIVAALRANGNAVAAGRTVADIDPEVLATVYPLSEAGVAHLFASGAGAGAAGVVFALAGSTEGDRRRAVERLATLPGRSYSPRTYSVLFEGGEAGSHYSEEDWFGHSVKEAPKPETRELDDAGERFRAARFVRPSHDRPLDVAAIRRRIGADASTAAVREVSERALAAETPWDSKAERGRMQKTGARLRREISAAREARNGGPVEVRPAAELDADRRASRPEERPAGWLEDPKLRSAVERRRKSGRAAYDTARAVALGLCPELPHKLLHILRREGGEAGASSEQAFLARWSALTISAADPEAAVRAALRTLAEAGKVRRVRSQKTGEVFVAATEPLDETAYRRTLNGLIRDESFGIVNPWASEASGAAEPEGEAGEWRENLEDLEPGELHRLAPKRLSGGDAFERSLPEGDTIAEESALEEIAAIDAAVAEAVAEHDAA